MGVFSSLSAKDAPDRVEQNFWSWDKRKKEKKNGSTPNLVGAPSLFHQEEAEKGLRGQRGSALYYYPEPTQNSPLLSK